MLQVEIASISRPGHRSQPSRSASGEPYPACDDHSIFCFLVEVEWITGKHGIGIECGLRVRDIDG